MLIKIILIVAIAAIAVYLVRATQDVKNVALRRVALLLFVVAAVVSILFPDIFQRLAEVVGVGRGTDLLLYLLIIGFLSYAVVQYRRSVILENRLIDLSRELAIARSHPDIIAPKPDNPEEL